MKGKKGWEEGENEGVMGKIFEYQVASLFFKLYMMNDIFIF